MMCQCTFFVYLFKQNYFKTHVKKKKRWISRELVPYIVLFMMIFCEDCVLQALLSGKESHKLRPFISVGMV